VDPFQETHKKTFGDAVDDICEQAKKLLAVCEEAGEAKDVWKDENDMLCNLPASAACLRLAHKIWEQTRPPVTPIPNPMLGAYGQSPFANPFNGPGPSGFGHKGPREDAGTTHRGDITETVFGSWEEAQAWLQSLPDDELSRVEVAMKGLTPEAAMEFLEKTYKGPVAETAEIGGVETGDGLDKVDKELEGEMENEGGPPKGHCQHGGCATCDPGPEGDPGPVGST